MVGRPITLNAEQVSGINHSKIDEEAGHPNLRPNIIAKASYSLRHVFLEWRVEAPFGLHGYRCISVFGELQELLQGPDAGLTGAVEPNVFCYNGGTHLSPFPGAGNQHVQAALAAITPHRSEILGEFPVGVSTITNGNEDDVPLVALDVFQVLDEELLPVA
jgi:hypothetical protein